MFVALQTLLATVASITTSMVANEDGTITVTVMPKAKKDGGNAALNTPLSLTGTAEELDAEFATLLASYTTKRSSLAEQLETTESVLEAAKKEAATKATKAVAKGKSPANPASAPATPACNSDCSSEDPSAENSVAEEAKPTEDLWG